VCISSKKNKGNKKQGIKMEKGEGKVKLEEAVEIRIFQIQL
jgi:hypothetical protein